jgi:selenide,water dikinase
MMQLNKIGAIMGKIDGVHAMTDVTGFGLLGHLIEMVEGSGMSTKINFSAVPLISDRLVEYIEMGSVPGGTNRNWDSYGHKVHFGNTEHQVLQKNVLADPQTSGGLLIAVSKDALQDVIEQLKQNGLSENIIPIGEITASEDFAVSVY